MPRCSAEQVVCGAAEMPMTPPESATARSASSPLSRGMSHSARAPAWVMNTGARRRRRRLDAGPVGGVRHVDREAEVVHPLHGAAAERGQPVVGGLVQPRAEAVGVGVGDADLPDAEPEQDVQLVEVVADRRGRLEAEHDADPAGCVRELDVLEGPDDHHPVLVGDVGLPHAQVGHHVVPLPGGVPGDVGGAVHHVVEHGGQAGRGQAGERGVLTAGAVVGRGLGHVGREPDRVIVQADHDAALQQRLGALDGGGVEAAVVAGHPARLRGEREPRERGGLVVEVAEGGVVVGHEAGPSLARGRRHGLAGGAGRRPSRSAARPRPACPRGCGAGGGTRWGRAASRRPWRTRRTASSPR